MYYGTRIDSPLGPLILEAENDNLTGLWFEGQRYLDADPQIQMVDRRELPIFRETELWLQRYFAGEKPDPGVLPLAPKGSAFRKEVCRLMLQIPYGQTRTYGQLAKQISGTMSAQAVGGAVGHNTISIIIPCHRVLGSRGALTGYAGGTKRKIWLLEHEGATGIYYNSK